MPDLWESAVGLNPARSDDHLDEDGDGATNGQEYVAGTHPRERSSAFVVSAVQPAHGGLRLSWWGVAERDYRVERRSGLAGAAPWDLVQSELTGQDQVLAFEIPGDLSEAGYYRVGVDFAGRDSIEALLVKRVRGP
jgi:hypothetical protein